MTYKERIEYILQDLNHGIYEKENTLKLILLSFLAGKSAFLYGPPGTAKSLVARRVSMAFKDDLNHTFFAYLMNRFSTPEEIFGPIDIGELKKNNLKRNTQGYLPTAHFAFLDEIWKSSPAILNTLLTIINEKIYRDGNTDINVPLKGLVCASNEFPTPNQGLEALYDRMILRLAVLPIKERHSFEQLLQTTEHHTVNVRHAFSMDDVIHIAHESKKVTFSSDALDAMHLLKSYIQSHNQQLAKTYNAHESLEVPDENLQKKGIYVSDRRWKNMAELLKTAAFLSDRTEVLPIDITLLQHCIWSDESHKESVIDIITLALKHYSTYHDEEYLELKSRYSDHYDAVCMELYHHDEIKSVSNHTKEAYRRECESLRNCAESLRIKSQQYYEKMRKQSGYNPFISEHDYCLAFNGIIAHQEEIEQLFLAIEQLAYIIHNQPIPIPPKYGLAGIKSAPTKPQELKKYRPKSKQELKELVANPDVYLGDIDTSLITDMSGLFQNSRRINAKFDGIHTWDTSNVTDMSYIFYGAINFNQPLDSWNVDRVSNMDYMFGATSLTQRPHWYKG